MDDVGVREGVEPGDVQRLVQQRPHIWPTSDSTEPPREGGVDRNKRNLMTRSAEPDGQRLCLNRLPAHDLLARRDQCDPHGRTPNAPMANGAATRWRAAE